MLTAQVNQLTDKVKKHMTHCSSEESERLTVMYCGHVLFDDFSLENCLKYIQEIQKNSSSSSDKTDTVQPLDDGGLSVNFSHILCSQLVTSFLQHISPSVIPENIDGSLEPTLIVSHDSGSRRTPKVFLCYRDSYDTVTNVLDPEQRFQIKGQESPFLVDQKEHTVYNVVDSHVDDPLVFQGFHVALKTFFVSA